jgi:pilus assembly protein CpaE
MSALTAVIIDSDAAQAASLKQYLTESAGWKIAGEARDLAAGHEIILRTKPNLIIIELEINRLSTPGFIERVSRENPGAGIIATSTDTSSDNILKAIRSGCLEFLPRPVKQEDLARAASKLERALSGGTAGYGHIGKVIACFSAKGGSGCTTAAVNIAAAIRETTDKEVLLADLDLEQGCADVFLNLKSKYSIADAVKNLSKLDQSFLQAVVSRHSSGINLLSCPARIGDMTEKERRQISPVLEHLKRVFDYVVLDVGGCYDDTAVQAIRNADMLVIVSTLSLPSIGNTQKALQYLAGMGLSGKAIKLLVNRFSKKDEINIKDAEKVFGKKVSWLVPNSYIDAKNSENKGQPLVKLFPTSETAKSYLLIAKGMEEMMSQPVAA